MNAQNNIIEQAPEFQTIKKIESFRYSLGLFSRNYEEINKFLDQITKEPHGLELMELKGRWKLDVILKEISYLLHNFVASASSLVDHSRVMYKKFYEPQKIFPDMKVK